MRSAVRCATQRSATSATLAAPACSQVGMRRRFVICCCLFALGAAAPAAQAGTATTANGNLNYTSTPGEVNNVRVARASGDTFTLTDLASVITAGTGCTSESANVVRCTTAPGRPIIVYLGDQNDRAASRTSRTVQFYGEDGNDRLAGASGRDMLDGGNGDDNLTGGPNRDRLIGGAGNDQLFGNGSGDQLQGSEGDDLLVGGSGNDNVSGGFGDDNLREEAGPSGSDSLNGDSGNDTVDYSARSNPVDVSLNDIGDDGDRHSSEHDNVHSSVDRVAGGAGSDVLIGSNFHSETLMGGTGDDLIDPLRGDDHVDGGPGIDQIRLRDLSRDDVVCGDGTDSVAADPRDATAADCEKTRRTAAMSLALATSRAVYPTVMVRLVCPASAFKFCAGKVLMRTLGRVGSSGVLTVAARGFSVAPGSEAVIGVRIRSGMRRYLGRHGLATRAMLSAFDGSGPARKDAVRFRLRAR